MSTIRATGSIAARPARSAGRCRRRSACAPPTRNGKIVALSGDYDFQFMIEELAVGAQHKLPYLHVVVNNSYLGLIRQSQRGFQMDFEVSLAFENINARRKATRPGYGVDHVAVAEGLGCKAIRVKSPNEFKEAFAKAQRADGGVSACRWWSSSFSSASPISRWGPRSTTSTNSRKCASIRMR